MIATTLDASACLGFFVNVPETDHVRSLRRPRHPATIGAIMHTKPLQDLAQTIADAIAAKFGGQTVYIPKVDKADFNGFSPDAVLLGDEARKLADSIRRRNIGLERIVTPLCTVDVNGDTWFIPDTFWPDERVACFPAPQGDSLRIESIDEPMRSTWASLRHARNLPRKDADTPVSSGNQTTGDAQCEPTPNAARCRCDSPSPNANPQGSSRSHTPGNDGEANPDDPITIRLVLEIRSDICSGTEGTRKPTQP